MSGGALILSKLKAVLRWSVAAVVFASAHLVCFGGPASPVTLDFLLADASAIVVAGIEGSIVDGKAAGNLVVERALKGELLPASAVQLTWTGRPTVEPISRRLHKDRGLFLLRKVAGGHWQIVPAMNGNVEFDMLYFLLSSGPKPEEYRGGPGTTIEEKIFLELAWAASVG